MQILENIGIDFRDEEALDTSTKAGADVQYTHIKLSDKPLWVVLLLRREPRIVSICAAYYLAQNFLIKTQY